MSVALKRWLSLLVAAFGVVVFLGADPALAESLPKDQHRQLFEQALRFSRQGDPQKALEGWDQVLELAPDDAAAWSNRGNVRLVLGDTEGGLLQALHLICPKLFNGTAL